MTVHAVKAWEREKWSSLLVEVVVLQEEEGGGGGNDDHIYSTWYLVHPLRCIQMLLIVVQTNLEGFN